MNKKNNRKKKTKFFRFFLVTALVLYFCVVFVKQEISIAQLRDSAKTLQVQINQRNQEKKKIEQDLKKSNYLNRVEEIARNKLGFLKSNEVLFVDSSEK